MINILIVDDSNPWRKSIKDYLLSKAPYITVYEAENGIEAVDKALRYKPAIVLMDVQMPKLNGFDATKKIMKSLETQIYIMSSDYSDELVLEAKEVGAVGYIAKEDALDWMNDILIGNLST